MIPLLFPLKRKKAGPIHSLLFMPSFGILMQCLAGISDYEIAADSYSPD